MVEPPNMRQFTLLCFCLLAVAVSHAAILSSTIIRDTTIDPSRIPASKGLAFNDLGTRLYRLASNATHGYLAAYSVSTTTGAHTFLTSIANSVGAYQRPFLGGCTDLSASTAAVYVICVSTVINATLTEPLRVMMLDPYTLAIAFPTYSVNPAWYSVLAERGPRISTARSFSGTSLHLGLGTTIQVWAGLTPPIGIPSALSGVPSTNGVFVSPRAVMVWGRGTLPTSESMRVYKRTDSAVDIASFSLFNSLKFFCATIGLNDNAFVVAVEKFDLTQPIRLAMHPMTYNAVSGRPTVSSTAFRYAYPAADNATSIQIPGDEKSILVLSPTTLMEYTIDRSAGTTDITAPASIATSDLGAADGLAVHIQGLFVYVSNGSGIVRFARDAVTTPPVVSLPVAAARYNTVRLQYTLPETPFTGSVVVTFTGASTYVLGMATLASVDISPSPSNITAGSGGIVVSGGNVTIADGSYTVTVAYRDQYQNDAGTTVVSGVIIDTVTQTPTLSRPLSRSVVRSSGFWLNFNLPEVMSNATLVFVPAGGSGATVTWLLDPANLIGGIRNVTIDSRSISSATTSGIFLRAVPSVPLDGVYNVTLYVTDSVANPLVASNTLSLVSLRLLTAAPSWISPASPFVAFRGTSVTWVYNLPSPATVGSVLMTFVPFSGTTRVLTMAYTAGTSGVQTRTFDILNPTLSGAVTSGSSMSASDYNVTIQYQDDAGNVANSATLRSVVIGLDSLAITRSGLANGDIQDLFTFNVTTPLQTASGQLVLGFSNANYSRNITVANTDPTSRFFEILALNISADPMAVGAVNLRRGFVVSANPPGRFPTRFLDQLYTVTAYAPDYAGRFTIATVLATSVTLSTPFCWFRLPCRTSACLGGNQASQIEYITENTTEVRYVDRIVYKDGVLIVYSNHTLTEFVPRGGGCSDAELTGYISGIAVLGLLCLLLAFLVLKEWCVTNGYSKVGFSD